MANGDGIVPPQGFNGNANDRTIFGMPLAVLSGGSGMKILIKPAQKNPQGSGMQVRIIAGTYSPAVLPPVIKDSSYIRQMPAGMTVKIVPQTSIQSGGGGTIVRVSTPIVVRSGAGIGNIKKISV